MLSRFNPELIKVKSSAATSLRLWHVKKLKMLLDLKLLVIYLTCAKKYIKINFVYTTFLLV